MTKLSFLIPLIIATIGVLFFRRIIGKAAKWIKIKRKEKIEYSVRIKLKNKIENLEKKQDNYE